ncbi:hypothetical protein, partial [Streptomyces sp. NPDC047981]|uniref:hypothetical protein n=1 Tax=Streptomyces sp. NPDC047981 TaxID=3154610 RepID=UPI003429E954
ALHLARRPDAAAWVDGAGPPGPGVPNPAWNTTAQDVAGGVDAAAWADGAGPPGPGVPNPAWNTTTQDVAGGVDAAAWADGELDRVMGIVDEVNLDVFAPDTAGRDPVPGPSRRPRKRKADTDLPAVVLHDPRPSSKQTREKDEQILAGINAAPAGSISDTARHMNMDPQTLNSWLQQRTSQLGLDSGTTQAQTLRYIRDHKDAVAVGMIRKRANDLAPYETPYPKILDERDKQVIATLLHHHPTGSITDIARHYGQRQKNLQNWVERLGKNLRVPGAAGEVVTYVRDNPDTVLRQAGLDSSDITTLPAIPFGVVAGLTPRDKQVIATLLHHHPTGSITDIARHYGQLEQTLHNWLGELGRSLRVPGAAGEVMAHVRDNPDTVLRQAGLDISDIATLTIPSGVVAGLTPRDKQVIATLLHHHPTGSITDIARHYGQRQKTLQRWVERLRKNLRVDVTGADVVTYVRDNPDTVLRQAGLDSSDITTLTIPFGEVADLTPRDKQVIATLLHHPALKITDIAKQYQHPRPTLEDWVNGLGRSLRVPGTAGDVVKYVRDNRDEVLAQAGLGKDITTLPPIPKGKK